tara:strand:+ start:451 stop:912 length:462 start_codon:yes stop_codon:yes gene_type:complete
MKISEINPNQGNIDATVEIVSIDEPREFEKYGRKLRVANAIAKDDSSEIKLTLWNDDIDKVKAGMVIHITNGYCSEFQGEKQLTTGKFGKFEVISGGNGEAQSQSTAPEVPVETPEVEETSPIPEEVIPEQTPEQTQPAESEQEPAVSEDGLI